MQNPHFLVDIEAKHIETTAFAEALLSAIEILDLPSKATLRSVNKVTLHNAPRGVQK